ncbi:hypothetical protein SAMN04489724_3213 [Algoriphagus locisalis]|uniref:Uncharacterized protein n=1 Tax=Algoriphagus locisalis TaxID=305507 RepID=A0A1I7CHY1_9BACT|nr:hypothetical protein [Algoriphagus locisalis]SFT98984.1 hypothetical protein SAMN04489724_3213 [Algoriphagus locisalis]
MSQFDFSTYIKSLSKDQLVALVLKFAPETYREQIMHLHLDDGSSKKVFGKISDKINRLFDDEELLYEPSDFEASITGNAEKLSAFWNKFPQETGELFLHCLKRINNIQDEGLLYNSYYDDIYNGSSFLEIIQQYAASLPFQQKIEFIQKMERELESFSYDTFYSYKDELNLIYNETDIPRLKSLFLEKVGIEDTPFRPAYYEFLRHTFDIQEKEHVLTHIYHLDRGLSLELADTMVQVEKPLEAIRFLEELRESNPNPMSFSESLFVKLIELKKQEGLPIKEDLISGLKAYRTHTLLIRAIAFLPENKSEFEAVLESVSHYLYLKYLIGLNRIDEAHGMVMKSKTLDEHSIHKFFTAYFKKYPQDASLYFTQLIDKELAYTGNQHYESIVNSLQYLRKVDAEKAKRIVAMLKVEYKRRRNLMVMLDGV